MQIAINSNKDRIHIKNYKGEKVFCPVCGGELIVKMGDVNIHHFAHKTKTDCDEWNEMSEWHIEWQENFPKSSREIVIENHRADVRLKNLIIEFQKSPISRYELFERIFFYTEYSSLYFVFDVREVYEKGRIYKYWKWDNWYCWDWPSKSIVPTLKRHKYTAFLQINDHELLKIEKIAGDKSWKKFKAIKINKGDFIERLNNYAGGANGA